MIVHETIKPDGTTTRKERKTLPRSLAYPCPELRELIQAAEKAMAFELGGKVTEEEFNAALNAKRQEIAKAYIAEHGMMKACDENSLPESTLDRKKPRPQPAKTEQPSAPAEKVNEDEVYRRYLKALCHLGHGDFDVLTDQELNDVAVLVSQKRYQYQKFKKSIGA